jgi:1,4-alpha-glucan branching enzyme
LAEACFALPTKDLAETCESALGVRVRGGPVRLSKRRHQVSPRPSKGIPTAVEPWYRNAVIYSVSVEAFMDGNGDGVGDFRGLRDRLDYLESLGVDALWLAPTYPTPNRDDGYDITDYYGIDGRLGSSGDFAEFLFEADGRGMRVLLDLVARVSSSLASRLQRGRMNRRRGRGTSTASTTLSPT